MSIVIKVVCQMVMTFVTIGEDVWHDARKVADDRVRQR